MEVKERVEEEEEKVERKNDVDYINFYIINIMPTTPRGQSTTPYTASGASDHQRASRNNRQQRLSNMNNNNDQEQQLVRDFQGLNYGDRSSIAGRRRRKRRRSSKRRKSRKSKRKRRRKRKSTKKKRRKKHR